MAYMRERQSKWDRRHLVTVSTHLNDRDYMDAEELHQACAEYLGDLYANLGQVWYPYDD